MHIDNEFEHEVLGPTHVYKSGRDTLYVFHRMPSTQRCWPGIFALADTQKKKKYYVGIGHHDIDFANDSWRRAVENPSRRGAVLGPFPTLSAAVLTLLLVHTSVSTRLNDLPEEEDNAQE